MTKGRAYCDAKCARVWRTNETGRLAPSFFSMPQLLEFSVLLVYLCWGGCQGGSEEARGSQLAQSCLSLSLSLAFVLPWTPGLPKTPSDLLPCW